jgi:hypothetical protein
MPASWRDKHTIKDRVQTLQDAETVISSFPIAVGEMVYLVGCHFQGTVEDDDQLVSRCPVALFTREGTDSIQAVVQVITSYVGNGSTLSTAAGAFATAAGRVDAVVTGEADTTIDWTVHYEIHRSFNDRPD